MKRTFLITAAVAAASFTALGPAHADARYPAKPVTMVVPFPPGGGTDAGARLIAQQLSKRWGQSVIVENKPGAAGNIGAEAVARAAPDGYTLLVGNVGTQSINQSLYKKLSFNPDTAFAPVSLIAELPLVMLVNPNVPAKSPKDMIALAAAKPGEIAYSTSGAGSAMHLAAELFADGAGVKLMHVPYKGGGPAVQDVLGNQVPMTFATVFESSGHIKAGKLRALAVTGDKRSPALPEVPTMAEAAIPGYNSISWIGVLAPAATPPAIVDKISADMRDVLNQPEVKERLLGLGATPAGNTPAQFRAVIEADKRRYGKLIRDKSISLD
ncbi:Tripartite-type tricarboxylate transporter, receptor component TctC [Noviherbaspirillum humi]|uniref:Tripartite-type tricarboxylate transporter, receptor component TctC n=1 Tax=Noviherbaspirillum humi TaxID=1688639 RepID=A0A239F3T7_9BURK|nr:tripartite tricarboxylate transporter substrate binding protein [Noviherbaspirillum humi]SNS51495.1 Tripartite-type tricarboxylate transporter, receptor component TctC [Noviherbaspirillum humi]